MKKTIAIIGSGYMAGIIGKKAHENNIITHCFGLDLNNYMKEHVDYFHEINIFDIDEICKICRDNHVLGVIATTELTILPTAQIAEKLKLNNNSVEVAKNITDKLWVRDNIRSKLKNPIIKQPEYYIYNNNLELSKLDNYPYIVKPDSAGGKRGINVVNNLQELENALKIAKDMSRNGMVLIEQFLSNGQEYSIESISFQKKHTVIQITEKESSGAPHCIELAHHQPADISTIMWHKVEKGISEIFDCIGIEYGPCHTEIKIINDEVYLIEINGRPGGDHIAYPLTELSTGYDYILGIIMCSLGQLEPINKRKFKHNYSGVCFVTKQTSYLKPIFDECEKYEWLYKKNKVTEELQEIVHNDGFNINYFMYCSESCRPNFK